MKLTTFLLFIFLVSTSANSFSQKFSFEVKDEAIKDVLSRIEAGSDYKFLYRSDAIDVSREITLAFNDENIDSVLEKIFDQGGTTYKIFEDNLIVIANSALQQRTVTGTVRDATTGDPLVGVAIQIQNTTLGTLTDASGRYSISVDRSDAVLIFSFIGYVLQTVPLAGKVNLDINLSLDLKYLDEVVVVGYGTQKKIATTSSVATIKGDALIVSPVANVNNSIAGRLPGVLTFQNSGAPGEDATTLRIRGVGTTGNANALIIVDGIPRSLSDVDPNEIETITVLKDAAAVAPYGIGGANGVILITTKRGAEGKLSLNYSSYYGLQQPTRMPEYLDSYGFANAVNTANENVGVPRAYSDEVLQKFKDGSDPDHYPNTDWVDEIMNFEAPMMRQTLSFTGGTQKVRFYSSLGYVYQEGVVPVINFKRYNLLVNVDADVTNSTTISLDMSGNQSKQSDPAGASGSGLFTDVTEIPPILPLQYSNGLPAHAMLPSIYESGYSSDIDNGLNMKLQIEQRVPFIPGLKFKGVFGYNKSYSFGKTWTLPRTFYKLDASDNYVAQPSGPVSPTLSESFGDSQQEIIQGYITYDKTFGKHALNVLGVYEGRNGISNNLSASRVNYELYMDELSMGSSDKNNFNNSGSSGSSSQMGLVYRLNYSYATKYLVELAGRYDGHYYFAPGKRFSFFPSFSAGWRLSEEKFIKDNLQWVDNMKLRISYGLSGNLAGSAFQYLTSYQTRNSYIFGGTSPIQVLGIYESAQANSAITWETAKKGDIGLDAVLFKGKIDFSIDYFMERRSDMLLSPATVVPSEYGIGLSQVNAGIMGNQGLDFSVGTIQDFAGGLHLDATFNFTYAQNKMIQTFETAATYNNPNRRQTGRPMNTRYGLEALGHYQVADFDTDGKLLSGLPVPTYGPVAPGDIRYTDLAGAPDSEGKPTGPDGKIDINDYTVIGHPNFPKIIFGFDVALAWKGFSLNTLWQGAGLTNIYLSSELAFPFFNGAKISKAQMDYWTPENTNAEFTRLTPTPITNNTQTSSFWVKDGTYLRLKTAEFGYNLPASVLNTIRFKSLRIFVSGQNLLTFNKIKYLDPELASDRARYYFQQKVYAFGVNVGF